jgi:lysyl-tRNA synthetase class II
MDLVNMSTSLHIRLAAETHLKGLFLQGTENVEDILQITRTISDTSNIQKRRENF